MSVFEAYCFNAMLFCKRISKIIHYDMANVFNSSITVIALLRHFKFYFEFYLLTELLIFTVFCQKSFKMINYKKNYKVTIFCYVYVVCTVLYLCVCVCARACACICMCTCCCFSFYLHWAVLVISN